MAAGMPNLFVVCDGVGGNPCGHIASQAVGDAIAHFFQGRETFYSDEWPKLGETIVDGLRMAVIQDSACSGLASTLAGVMVYGQDAWAFWCGDSRIYQVREGQIQWQSTDHNLQEDFLRKGQEVPSGLRGHALIHVASQFPSTLHISRHRLSLWGKDRLLICTDGVHGFIPQENWLAAMDRTNTCEAAAKRIEQMAQSSSKDNYSAWVLEWGIKQ
jgi:protein phosphatase